MLFSAHLTVGFTTNMNDVLPSNHRCLDICVAQRLQNRDALTREHAIRNKAFHF